MTHILKLFMLSAVFLSCNHQPGLTKPTYTSLDSLLNFDTITAIYTDNDLPPKITDDVIEGNSSRLPLHVDSINRWTANRSVIDSIRLIFPKLNDFGYSVWETTCCGYKELIFKTKKGEHVISWLNFDEDNGGVKFDETYRRTNTRQLNRIINTLDRKIIRKEIYSADSVNYSLNDYYNKRNTDAYNIMGETRYVYLLK